jgi:hypothetical protein
VRGRGGGINKDGTELAQQESSQGRGGALPADTRGQSPKINKDGTQGRGGRGGGGGPRGSNRGAHKRGEIKPKRG